MGTGMEGVGCVSKTVQVHIRFLSFPSSLVSLCGWGPFSSILEPHTHPALLQNPSSVKILFPRANIYN